MTRGKYRNILPLLHSFANHIFTSERKKLLLSHIKKRKSIFSTAGGVGTERPQWIFTDTLATHFKLLPISGLPKPSYVSFSHNALPFCWI